MTKTTQDFRNELQQMHFKALNSQQVTGNTTVSNLLTGLIFILDHDYGTKYEPQEPAK